LLPVILVVTIPVVILYNAREYFFDIDKLLKESPDYRIGYAYNESNYKIVKAKFLQLNDKQTVIAVGSSRVLQFRAHLFDVPFYNAGYTISRINDFIPFLEIIPKKKTPKILILGLDQWMFNENWDKLDSPSTKIDNRLNSTPSISTIKHVYRDLFNGKYSFSSFNTTNNSPLNIGLNAFVNKKGLRNDGSMDYGDLLDQLKHDDSSVEDYQFKNTYRRIEKGIQRFEYGERINDRAIFELEKLLKYCANRKIKVVAFLPPFADEVKKKMDATGKYNYIETIMPALSPYFNEFQFELYDFSNMGSFGGNDEELLDGFHGSEVAYAKILLTMINRNSILKKTVTRNNLEQTIQHAKTPYSLE